MIQAKQMPSSKFVLRILYPGAKTSNDVKVNMTFHAQCVTQFESEHL